jgi:aspartyl-tRNA(Asn)/glutamyl-tRNA(Gln) amidotransferase subunit A
MSEAFAIHEHSLTHRPEDYGAVTRYRILPGAMISAAEYLAALRQQRECASQTLDVLDGVDVLLTATTFGPAPVQAAMRAEANFARPPLTNPFNLAQLPAITICNGYSEEGLPLAMQIAGRRFDEATCLKVARAYEKATPWRDRRPQLREPESDTAVADPRASSGAQHEESARDYAAMSQRLELGLDEAQFRDLVEAMPHVEAMIDRLRRDRPYTEEPSLIFRHVDSDGGEESSHV